VPAKADCYYDEDHAGWVLVNRNGVLALVHDDGTITAPVHDGESWVLAD
jgi:hypothetical protein